MPSALDCPEREAMERLHAQIHDSGSTSGERERLAAHREQCEACRQLFAEPGALPEPPGALSSMAVKFATTPPVELPALEERTLVRGNRPAVLPHEAKPGDSSGSPFHVGPPEEKELDLSFLAPPQKPGEIGRLGSYRVLKQLGAGGMGAVFLAEDAVLKRNVALKTMLPNLAVISSARERFLREARAAAGIEHPNIVAIYQVGEDRGIPFMAMALLKGETLEDRLARDAKLKPTEAIRVAASIAAGLAAAHAHGLIHRDIKPANVWLEDASDLDKELRQSGQRSLFTKVKLLDFGLARSQRENTQLTQSGVIVGTPAFMSPEQARGRDVDERADLFSLGAVLYTMLTGKRPFNGETILNLLVALAMDMPPAPHYLEPEVPVEISQYTLVLLAKDRDKRPATAAEVAVELRRLEKIANSREKAVESGGAPPVPAQQRPPPIVLAPPTPPWWRGTAVFICLTLLASVAGVCSIAFYRLTASRAELVVESADDALELVIKLGNSEPRVEEIDKHSTKTLSFTPGTGEITARAMPNGVRAKTSHLELKAGDRVTFTAKTLLADKKSGPQSRENAPGDGETILGQRPFVVIRKDNHRDEYGQLHKAIERIVEGDIIEVAGDGPYNLNNIVFAEKSFTVRAAIGSRPLFLVGGRRDNCLRIRDGANVRFEGCDWIGSADWLLHAYNNVDRIEFDNCRVYGQFLGGCKQVRAVDSLFVCPLGVFAQFEPESLELVNNIVTSTSLSQSWSPLLKVPAISAELRGNTLQSLAGPALELILGSKPGEAPRCSVTNNLFASRLELLRLHAAAEITGPSSLLQWQGEGNYFALPASWAEQELGKESRRSLAKSLVEWTALWQQQGEKRSAAIEKPHHLHEIASLPIEPAIEMLRLQCTGVSTPDNKIGPDWLLVGPGEAYVRAAGKAIEIGRTIRPAPHKDGPFVTLRGNKEVRGHPTLQQALDSLERDEILEVRADGPVEGGTARGGAEMSLRAALGYRPVIQGDLHLGSAKVHTIEGLDIRGKLTMQSNGSGSLDRLANCSITGGIQELRLPARTEVVNSYVLGVITLRLLPGADLALHGSVLTELHALSSDRAGVAHIHLDRCVLWNSEPGASNLKLDAGKCKAALVARQTLFDAGSEILAGENPPLAEWSGSCNVYRQFQPGLLGVFKTRYGSKEDGSHESPPALFDPQLWRLMPGSPGSKQGSGGKDVGAEVDRIARSAMR